jgi:hypothetical protein
MSASLTGMHDFVEALRRQVPRDIHPSASEAIRWYFADMRDAVEDPAEVLRLTAKVCDCVVQELNWCAEDLESARAYRDAHRARRQAERFAVRWRVEAAA